VYVSVFLYGQACFAQCSLLKSFAASVGTLTGLVAAVQVTKAVTQAHFNDGFVKLEFSVVAQPLAIGAAQLSHTSVSAIPLPETRKMNVVVSLSSVTAHSAGRVVVSSRLPLG
jgi:hypothetical protein